MVFAPQRGDVIVRIDAHARYVSNYVSSLVSALIELNADNVGGSIVTLPANASSEAIAVATVLSHPLGVGNSTFRVGNDQPTLVDTVPFGCFQRTIFDRGTSTIHRLIYIVMKRPRL